MRTLSRYLIALSIVLVAWLGWTQWLPPPATPPVPEPPAPGAPPVPANAALETTTTDAQRALAAPRLDTPVFIVQGLVLAARGGPSPAGAIVQAYAGEPQDENGNLLGGMAGPSGWAREPAFVQRGDPIASAPVDGSGKFALRTTERHLRLQLDHDLYGLALPEMVHVPAATRQTTVVLVPYLGGCLRGRLFGAHAPDVREVRLVLEPDAMAVMRDSNSLIATMTALARAPAVPDDDGAFAFRAVPTAGKLLLSATGSRSTGRLPLPPLAPGEVREVALPVQRALELPVAVVDDRGGPVAGATVTVRTIASGPMPLARLTEPRATTDHDGRCVVAPLTPGMVEATATARGRIAAAANVELPADGFPPPLRLVLGEGGVVTGTVLAADDSPVADARVAHHGEEALPLLGDLASQLGPEMLAALANDGVRTDASGRYRLTGLADPGEFLVIAAHPDHSPGTTRGVRMGDQDVVVRLAPLGGVRGTAVAADGNPLPQFTATLLRTSFLVLRMPVRRETFAAADGAFAFARLAPGSYTLRLEAEGHSDVERSVDVQPGEPLDVGALTLAIAAEIRGVVLDLDDRPVPAALVRRRQGAMADHPMLAMFGAAGARAHSDDDGRFRLAPLPPGRLQLLATAAGFAPGRSERLELVAGQALDGVVIRLDHGGTIAGRLRVAPGQRPAEFLVLAQHQSTQASANADLADDGSFTITDLEPGPYAVQAMPHDLLQRLGGQDWKPGESLRLGETMQQVTDNVVSQRCSVRAGAVTEVELDASDIALGARWVLRVRYDDGAAVDGLVEVTAMDDGRMRVAMLADGTATLARARPGPHRVQVRSGLTMAPIGGPQDVDFPAGRTEHVTTLRLPAGELRGRVVDAATGAPLRGAVVRLLHAGAAELDDPLGMALTDDQGAFVFAGLRAGTYGLLAADPLNPGGSDAASRRDGVRVVPGTPAEPIELRSAPAATAGVLVTTAGGAPVAGATLLCLDADGHTLGAPALAVSGADGRAWFGGLPRGAARVVGRALDHAPAATPLLQLDPATPAEFTLVLPAGAPVTLLVVDRDGQPLRGATLTARCSGGPWLPGALLAHGTRADGAVDLGRLAAGSWQFRVQHPAIGSVEQTRTLDGRTPVHVVVAPR